MYHFKQDIVQSLQTQYWVRVNKNLAMIEIEIYYQVLKHNKFNKLSKNNCN